MRASSRAGDHQVETMRESLLDGVGHGRRRRHPIRPRMQVLYCILSSNFVSPPTIGAELCPTSRNFHSQIEPSNHPCKSSLALFPGCPATSSASVSGNNGPPRGPRTWHATEMVSHSLSDDIIVPAGQQRGSCPTLQYKHLPSGFSLSILFPHSPALSSTHFFSSLISHLSQALSPLSFRVTRSLRLLATLALLTHNCLSLSVCTSSR